MIRQIDIAARLKLSRITVSAVLNDRYQVLGISEQTAERVRETAKNMGYQRNQLAMAVKTGKTYTLGFLMSADRPRVWLLDVLAGSLSAVRSSPYMLEVEMTRDLPEQLNALNLFMGQRVEGVLCLNVSPDREGIRNIRELTARYKVPVVCTNCAGDLSDIEVEQDHEGGARLALKHLVDLGHRQIAFLGGVEGHKPGMMRKMGFVNGLSEFGLGLGQGHLRNCDWKVPEAEAATAELLKDRQRAPTAIVCANDDMAAGAVRSARQLGVRVPEDLSVVGMSNERLTEMTDPPLTTVDMQEETIGRKALERLIEVVESDRAAAPPKQEAVIVPAGLVIRQSTAPPPLS